VTGTTYADINGWWWLEYEDMLREMKRDPKSGWAEVDQWVAH
jgi:hypothetical protein